jgi:2-hydroxy-3-keto-5-methylthiopentenyl-1-phosphate phosphatase
MRIFCDFDGTISRADTTDHILSLFAGPQWEDLEQDWLAGRITAAACMRAQIALITADDSQLDQALDEVPLTPGFPEFAAWCAGRGLALSIVSDGVDYFIRRILDRYGLAGLPVISNRLAGDAAGRDLDQPWRRAGCAAGSGVCKCAVVDAAGEPGPLVFIGDGRSDFCVSARADILFARDSLAAYAADRGMGFHPFDDFNQVTRILDQARRTRLAAAG